MNPKNISCLTTAKIDCCALGNNHILDWGYSGLEDTLKTLKSAGIRAAGAGRSLEEAQAPAVLDSAGEGSVVFFSFGSPSSGVQSNWAATEDAPGVNMVNEEAEDEVEHVRRLVEAAKGEGDVVVVSIHWGSNWGYEVQPEQLTFAHRLIDEAGVDLIHGHSSHHPRAIDVYKGKLILYGCGDFLNDYEGIRNYEEFRGDLGVMYFPAIDSFTGNLTKLQMVPTQIRKFKVNNATREDSMWLCSVLDRESRQFGCQVKFSDGFFELSWR
jgi:poly-gamma-glutamate capsule biosynthesis protein CapA/YwtB (metallophosphatase superfamily)